MFTHQNWNPISAKLTKTCWVFQISSLSLQTTTTFSLCVQFTIQKLQTNLSWKAVGHIQSSLFAPSIQKLQQKINKKSAVIFPETISLSLRIICRPRRGQFLLELLSIEEIVPMKTFQSETSLFLERLVVF